MQKLPNLTISREHSENNRKTGKISVKKQRHRLMHVPKGREILYSK
jgi:hypothetical protein